MVILQELGEYILSSPVCPSKDNLASKLFFLAERKGYEIIQANGQRIYAPPASWNIPPPPKGCEVFIGGLYKNIFEDELIPLFETVGPLYKFRLMMDFREKTRGYAFATYFTRQHADLAVQQLNGYKIRRGVKIGVFKSVDNRRLFVGNLPPQATRLDVKKLVEQYADGVVDVIMYKNPQKPQLNRGFVFVEFESHRLAAMARRQFTPDNLTAWGQALYVDWADPLPEVHPDIMAKVSVLYLKNLPAEQSSDEIFTIVCDVIGSYGVVRVKKIQNYAFVHLINRRIAELAFEKLDGLIITAKQDCHQYFVEVEWARPRCFSKKYRLVNPPDNLCTSVPPNLRRRLRHRVTDLTNSSSLSRSEYDLFVSQVQGCSSPQSLTYQRWIEN